MVIGDEVDDGDTFVDDRSRSASFEGTHTHHQRRRQRREGQLIQPRRGGGGGPSTPATIATSARMIEFDLSKSKKKKRLTNSTDTTGGMSHASDATTMKRSKPTGR